MAEGARLESVFAGNCNVGSNPTLSARIAVLFKIFKPLICIFLRKDPKVNAA